MIDLVPRQSKVPKTAAYRAVNSVVALPGNVLHEAHRMQGIAGQDGAQTGGARENAQREKCVANPMSSRASKTSGVTAVQGAQE